MAGPLARAGFTTLPAFAAISPQDQNGSTAKQRQDESQRAERQREEDKNREDERASEKKNRDKDLGKTQVQESPGGDDGRQNTNPPPPNPKPKDDPNKSPQ